MLLQIRENFLLHKRETARCVHHVAEFFGAIAQATRNPVLVIAQEPLIQLLEPSLGAMIDKVQQARERIATAQRRLSEAVNARDPEEARVWMTKHIRDFRRGYEVARIDLRHKVSAR